MSKHIATTTQGEHPWRAVIRTVFALVIALAAMAEPLYSTITQQDPVSATGPALAALAIAGAITRVMAMPMVEQFLQRFLPWLAASARGHEEPLPAGTDLDQITGSGAYPIADEHEPTSRTE